MTIPSLGLRVALEHRQLVRRVVDTLRRFPGAAVQFEAAIDRVERDAAEKRLAAASPTVAAPPEPPPAPKAPAATLFEVPQPKDEAQEAVKAWNEMAGRIGLPQVQKVDGKRLIPLRARLRECGGLSGWAAALKKVEGSALMRGERGSETWRGATFDWVCTARNFAKLMEGNYDDDARRSGRSADGLADILEGVAAGLAGNVGARR